jgi:hypothetical protein
MGECMLNKHVVLDAEAVFSSHDFMVILILFSSLFEMEVGDRCQLETMRTTLV